MELSFMATPTGAINSNQVTISSLIIVKTNFAGQKVLIDA